MDLWMQDSAGYVILGLIILLFTVGSISIVIDMVFNQTKDSYPQNLEPENLDSWLVLSKDHS